MSRLQQMRLIASTMQSREPADLLKVAMTMAVGGGKISVAACVALAEQKEFDRQVIHRHIGG